MAMVKKRDDVSRYDTTLHVIAGVPGDMDILFFIKMFKDSL